MPAINVPSPADAAFPAGETHGIALWPTNRLVAHSDGLGWHNVYASLAAERSWSAELAPVKHYCLAYCLHRPARVSRRIDGEGKPVEAILRPRSFGVVPADRISRWMLEGNPDILLIYLRRTMVDTLASEFFDEDRTVTDFRSLLGDNDPLLEQLALAVLDALRRKDRDSNGLYADGMAQAIATQLIRHHLRDGRSHRREPDGPAPLGMRRLRDFIEAELDSDLSLDRLAREACTSAYVFPGAFRRAFGMPPHQYVLTRRLARAREMLIATDLPIVDIALATGFSSQSHLASAFKRLVGVTPAEYRRAPDPGDLQPDR